MFEKWLRSFLPRYGRKKEMNQVIKDFIAANSIENEDDFMYWVGSLNPFPNTIHEDALEAFNPVLDLPDDYLTTIRGLMADTNNSIVIPQGSNLEFVEVRANENIRAGDLVDAEGNRVETPPLPIGEVIQEGANIGNEMHLPTFQEFHNEMMQEPVPEELPREVIIRINHTQLTGQILYKRCANETMRMGDLVMFTMNDGIVHARGIDIVDGIVINGEPYGRLDMNEYLRVDEMVQVYVGNDVEVNFWLGDQLFQAPLYRLQGRLISDIMEEFRNEGLRSYYEPKPRPKPKPVPEFVINKYITLKLEGKKTKIYVMGLLFIQCKFLLLNLEGNREYEEIESIDDAAKHLSDRMERNHSIIPPETEFWGHCSNLQTWYENDYNLNIIHTNLGFPLLKRLCECGDKKALGAMKDELFLRVEKGGYKAYLSLTEYMKFLTPEEMESIKPFIKPPRPSKTILEILNNPEDYEYEIFSAGSENNNNVGRKGAFLSSLAKIGSKIQSRGIVINNIKIFSDIETYQQSLFGNHFYGEYGLTEFERIIGTENVDFWNYSMEIERRTLIFIVNDHYIFESGELSW